MGIPLPLDPDSSLTPEYIDLIPEKSRKRGLSLIAARERRRLAADGVAVVINYTRSPQPAQETVNAIIARGGKAVAVQADVSKPDEVRRLFDEAEKALGQLDIVVANAGVFLRKPLAESTEDDYDHVFNINTKGVFLTLREAASA